MPAWMGERAHACGAAKGVRVVRWGKERKRWSERVRARACARACARARARACACACVCVFVCVVTVAPPCQWQRCPPRAAVSASHASHGARMPVTATPAVTVPETARQIPITSQPIH